jgi:hypothetical protein
MTNFKEWIKFREMGVGLYIGNCIDTDTYQVLGACSDQNSEKRNKKYHKGYVTHKKVRKNSDKFENNELNNNIFQIPLSNIWIMHWSVNPRNLSRLDWIRNNYENSFSKKYPQGFIGETSDGEFSEYHRLVDEEEYDEFYNSYKIKPNILIPIDKNYPKIFLGDGTHRAIIAFERNDEFIAVKIENLNEHPIWIEKLKHNF